MPMALDKISSEGTRLSEVWVNSVGIGTGKLKNGLFSQKWLAPADVCLG
jgi:hypothetical protein